MQEEPPYQARRATAWRRPTTDGKQRGEAVAVEEGCDAGASALEPGRLYGRVAGRDRRARLLSAGELAGLGDPMADLFRAGAFPLTVRELLSKLPERDPPARQVYLVSEAGQISPASASGLHRDMRFVITDKVRDREVDLLVATQATGDPGRAFLQVVSWDSRKEVFNFYTRIGPAWLWAGDSWDALEPDSRGKGCFDSHVNGSVVMKELREPWMNWQSQRAKIQVDAADPLKDDPLYRCVDGAEKLEKTVEALVRRWTRARLAKVTAAGVVTSPHHLLRQLLTTTTVNLASTDSQSGAVTPADPPLVIPMGFWLNAEALLDNLRLRVTAAPPRMQADKYVDSLDRFGLHLREGDFRQPGDAFFAFVVPEASFEDNEVINQMVSTGLLSAKFAACMLMVDFPNPVFSPSREHLMKYVPCGPVDGSRLDERIAESITEAVKREKLPAESPEGEFAAHWRLSDEEWPTVFTRRVEAYLKAVAERIRTQAGFDDYVRLAESRRRQFRSMKLHEFMLTTPYTNIPDNAPLLAMREDGTVDELAPT
ncbi:hypothetical protein ACFVHW_22835 [Streptomyces sp. NPDC127110]|uniref:hypothetical protein n=1 Tax=Streptomyces sp. NPDC127110 TaxID=3345362 RepID=UPI003638366E